MPSPIKEVDLKNFSTRIKKKEEKIKMLLAEIKLEKKLLIARFEEWKGRREIETDYDKKLKEELGIK